MRLNVLKGLLLGVACISLLWTQPAVAQNDGGGFSIQVTPSPLIATLTPGKKTTLDLRINNTGTKKEEFTMELRTFSVSRDSGEVTVGNDAPELEDGFVTFEQPTFMLEPGEWINQKIYIDTPQSAGFSYNFAVLIKRKGLVENQTAGTSLQGSVAVFTLLNVDRPDAVRKLELEKVVASRRVYEYLPSELTITVKNSGNTIVAPDGNVFFSRSETDTTSLGTTAINQAAGSILPDSTRTFSVKWEDGFPLKTEENGSKKTVWDYSKLSSFRIGKYTAKVLLIYDDGVRDVPLEATVSFWVIPWKILGGMVLILGLTCIGLFTLLKKSAKLLPKKPSKASKDELMKDE
jgi:hypothetical protein